MRRASSGAFVAFLGLLGACASTPGHVAKRTGELTVSTGQPDHVPFIRGPGSLAFREARSEVARLSLEYDALRMVATGTGSAGADVVDLPLTAKATDITTLVVVAVFHGHTRVGARDIRTDAELDAATSSFAGSPGTVALLRVDDEADLDDVIHVSKALHDRGIAVRVLGSVAPNEPLAKDRGSDCKHPASIEVGPGELVVVQVRIDEDGQGRAGVVHVLETPRPGFAWPAAVCATLTRFTGSSAPAGPGAASRLLAVRFER